MTDLADWCRSEVKNRPPLSDEQAEALGRLVIVTPSRNRQDFLVRQVASWGGTPVRLLLLDGSDEAVPGEARSLFDEHPNVDYRHEPVGWAERLTLAGREIDRPYAVLCGDDEFLMPAGLAAAIGSLDRDLSMAGCVGQCLRFFPTRRFRRLAFEAGYDYWRPRPDDGDPVARIRASMADYDAVTCYAVLRADVWKASWGSVGGWSTPALAEVQQALSVHARGRIGTVDDLYWLRSEENPPVDRDLRRLTLGDWWTSAEHSEERDRYLDRVAGDLVLVGASHGVAARVVAEEAVDALVRATDRRNESGGWTDGRPPDAGHSGLVGAIRDLSHRFLPDTIHLALGDALEAGRRLFGRSSMRRYGGVRRVENWCPDRLVTATPEISEELERVERLVRTFHPARQVGAGRPWT